MPPAKCDVLSLNPSRVQSSGEVRVCSSTWWRLEGGVFEEISTPLTSWDTQIHFLGASMPPAQNQSTMSTLTKEGILRRVLLYGSTCSQLEQKHPSAKPLTSTELAHFITAVNGLLLEVVFKDRARAGSWWRALLLAIGLSCRRAHELKCSLSGATVDRERVWRYTTRLSTRAPASLTQQPSLALASQGDDEPG